jgi:predicted small metal-binding protein
MKNLACNDVIPGGPFTARAETEDALLEAVAEHADHAHGVKEVTPELLRKVQQAIRTEEAAK